MSLSLSLVGWGDLEPASLLEPHEVWEPSHRGFARDAPQRHRARSATGTFCPSAPTSRNEPSTTSGPDCTTLTRSGPVQLSPGLGATWATLPESSNPTPKWASSQSGRLPEAPHRHSPTRVSLSRSAFVVHDLDVAVHVERPPLRHGDRVDLRGRLGATAVAALEVQRPGGAAQHRLRHLGRQGRRPDRSRASCATLKTAGSLRRHAEAWMHRRRSKRTVMPRRIVLLVPLHALLPVSVGIVAGFRVPI